MSDEKARPWREIASEMCNEQDPERLSKLCEELTRALDEQRPVKRDSKSTGAQ
jgi:hypothetical protein